MMAYFVPLSHYMQVIREPCLKEHNSFGFEVRASIMYVVEEATDLQELYQNGLFASPVFVLGGGSNILLRSSLETPVVKIGISGKRIQETLPGFVEVEVGAGEVWHSFVQWSVQNGYGGIENLSLIPGTVGAAPMQNIGAYGVELEQVFVSLKAFDKQTGEFVEFERKPANLVTEVAYLRRLRKGDTSLRKYTCGFLLRITNSILSTVPFQRPWKECG